MAVWTTKYGYAQLVVTATESDVSVANNTSKVNVTVQIKSTSSQRVWNNYNQSLSVKVDGASIGSRSFTYDFGGGGGTSTLGNYSMTVTHSSDGSKMVPIVVSVSGGGDSASISQSLKLTTIARASVPTLSASSVAMGSSVRINTNRASSSFTHTITYKFGTVTKTVATKTTNASVDWTVPNDLATQIPNNTSGLGSFTVTTYNGNNSIGSKNINLTLTVPNNATFNPTITAPTVSEAVSSVTSAVGSVYVQGKSKFKLTATPTTRQGATVKSVVFTVKSATYTASGSGSGNAYTATTGLLDSTGAHAISVKVTDSRGRTATANIASQPSVLAYSAPSITKFTAVRNSGSTTNVTIARTVSYRIVGTNTVTVKIDKEEVGLGRVGTVEDIQLTTGTTNTNNNIINSDNADTKSYKFIITVSDKLSDSVTMTTVVGTSQVPMSWGKAGMSAGKIYDVEVGEALQVGGNIIADGGYEGDMISRRLSANTNLNNITKAGFYHSPSNADAETISNTPSSFAFSLLVETHAGIKQTFTEYHPENPNTYIRNFYNGNWGRWFKLTMT